jgi:hypothetical protein
VIVTREGSKRLDAWVLRGSVEQDELAAFGT